ncbi:MAG: FtsX-like permease family protein [Christensenellales bacterium]
MKTLSPFGYYRANPKKFLLICIVLALSVCAVSFVSAMLTGYLNDNYVCLEAQKHFSYVTPAKGEQYIKADVIDEIIAYDEVEKALPCSVQTTLYQGLVAGIASGVYTMRSVEDVQAVLDCVGDRLTSGRLPEYGAQDGHIEYEVIMHERLLKNKGLSVGDCIGSDMNDMEGLQGKFTIVGEISGPTIISFANYDPSVVAVDGTEDKGTYALLLLPVQNRLSSLNEKLQSLGKERASISTYEYYSNIMQAQTSTLYGLAVAVVVVVALILAISLGSLTYINYLSRMDEFGILYTLGHPKRKIAGMICCEIFVTALIGWGIGYALFGIILAIINFAMLSPHGQGLTSFDWFGLVATLIIPLTVALCSLVPVTKKLKKTDVVSIIERRE